MATFRRTKTVAFSQFFNWDKIDICKLTEDVNSYHLFRDYLKIVNDKFNGLIHSCPYRGLNFINASISAISDNLHSIWPNGEIKVCVNLYSRKGKQIMFYQIVVEQNLKKV